jgi:hypothetical protein
MPFKRVCKIVDECRFDDQQYFQQKRMYPETLKEKMMDIDTKLKKPKIDRLSDNLFLITLDPSLRGFENFIGAWLYKGDINFIVDVGPSITAPGLIKALEDLGVTIWIIFF